MWKTLSRISDKIKPGVVASMPILLFSLFILINVAIWWAGPWLSINGYMPLTSMVSRAIASIVFSLFCLSLWGIFQWRKLVSIKHKEKRQEELNTDPLLVFEEQQEIALEQIMKSMKSSLNNNYLYALPWYLVLGKEGAGKTSLINRSGQNFSFSSVLRATKEKNANQYGFDWWIGDHSVLIDPDGELLSQGRLGNSVDTDLTRRLWVHFMHWLERTRSRRPLNGIILAIDISELAVANESDRKAYSNILRTRLRELMETLSTRLPVYVSFTKLDLLYGFEPYFRHLTKSQREEVLGFTFTLESVENLDRWLSEFMTKYDTLAKRISDNLPHIIANLSDSEEKSAVYSFSRQIAGLRETIYRMLDETLASDQFSTSALVRGVYFNSVYQQGVAINAFDNATSRRYGLPNAINTAQNAKNSTVFFTPNLFSKIIYPEAGLASDNFRVVKHKKRIIYTAILTCSIASILMVSAWHRYYLMNIERSDGVLTKVYEYQSLVTDNAKGLVSNKDMLEPLNKIREATLEFGFFREKPKYFSDMGLYQGHVIGPKVEQTYLNLLEYKFLALLMGNLIHDLNSATTDEQKLAVLRVYRMLVDGSGRHSEFVLDYFAKYWQRQFSGQRDVQKALLSHLEYAMQHTDLTSDRLKGHDMADKLMRPYDLLISRVQNELGQLPNEERVYRNLKLSAKTILGPDVSIRNLIGPVYDVVYQEGKQSDQSLYIPKLFTKEGFEEYFMPQSESVSKLALIDSWVLGLSSSAKFSEEDKRVLRQKIRDLYIADYTSTWNRALNTINITQFSDINEAVNVVDNLIGNLEPIQRLLRTVNTNTKLFPVLPEDKLAQAELVKTPKFRVASKIDEPFSDLNGLSISQPSQPAYITEVLDVVRQLHDYLRTIQDSPNVGMSALNATKERVQLQNVDPIYTLRRIATSLPSPLDRMMETLSDQSWYVVKKEAIRYLEIRWQDDVYRFYKEKLANRYPLVSDARKEIALADFERFFAPDGVLNSFYNEQLKLFLQENISLQTDDTNTSIISAKVLDEIEQARKIQNAFFNRKGVLDLEFTLQPVMLSSNKRRSAIDLDGQYVVYSHGKKDSVDLIWPNSLRDTASSKITLVPNQAGYSPRSIVMDGSWSLFRLLDKAAVNSATSMTVDYKFSLDNGSMVYRLKSYSDTNPFSENLFSSFALSEHLY